MKIAEIMTPDPITIAATAPLSEAIATMSELDVRHLPVVREGEVVGVISDRDLLQATGWVLDDELDRAAIFVADVVEPEPMTLEPEESVAALAQKLFEWGVGCAPVVEDGLLRGIATEIDVLGAFVSEGASGGDAPPDEPRVEDRMTTDVATLDAGTTATEALALMRDRNIRHLCVVEDLRVLGMVSDRDLRCLLGRRLPVSTPVREFMSTTVQTAAPDDGLNQAARTMSSLKIGALPVVDRGALVGIITVTDLLEHCATVLG
jgi:CBS domain-containing protein